MTGRSHGLTLRKQKFVGEYLSNGGNAAAAARAAGYAPDHASHQGWVLTNKDPAVRAELERARAELADRTDYKAEKAMQELGDVIAFARETKNATAMARAIELRMRMAGLLVEKVDLNVSAQIDIVGALLEGRARAGLLEHDDHVFDAEYQEIGKHRDSLTTTEPTEIGSPDIFS